MPYVRLSLMMPTHGHESEVNRINSELVEFYKTRPGFIAAYRLEATDGTGEVGRISIWENAADADHTAMTDHDMALRSELHLIIQPGHIEKAYNVVQASHPQR